MSKKYTVDLYPLYSMGCKKDFTEKFIDRRNFYRVTFNTLKEAQKYAREKITETLSEFERIEVLRIIDRNLYEIIEEY